MGKDTYAKTPTEVLQRSVKLGNFSTGLLVGVLLALFGLNIYNIVNGDQNWGMLLIPLALLPILFLNFSNIKKMKEELKNRE